MFFLPYIIHYTYFVSVRTIFGLIPISENFRTESSPTSRTSDGLGHFFLKLAPLDLSILRREQETKLNELQEKYLTKWFFSTASPVEFRLNFQAVELARCYWFGCN